jgi:hypothetical protein
VLSPWQGASKEVAGEMGIFQRLYVRVFIKHLRVCARKYAFNKFDERGPPRQKPNQPRTKGVLVIDLNNSILTILAVSIQGAANCVKIAAIGGPTSSRFDKFSSNEFRRDLLPASQMGTARVFNSDTKNSISLSVAVSTYTFHLEHSRRWLAAPKFDSASTKVKPQAHYRRS